MIIAVLHQLDHPDPSSSSSLFSSLFSFFSLVGGVHSPVPPRLSSVLSMQSYTLLSINFCKKKIIIVLIVHHID